MLENKKCGECGENHDVCPDCGSHMVTPLEPQKPLRATTNVNTFVMEADDGDSAKFTNICWDCGWQETRTVTITID